MDNYINFKKGSLLKNVENVLRLAFSMDE